MDIFTPQFSLNDVRFLQGIVDLLKDPKATSEVLKKLKTNIENSEAGIISAQEKIKAADVKMSEAEHMMHQSQVKLEAASRALDEANKLKAFNEAEIASMATEKVAIEDGLKRVANESARLAAEKEKLETQSRNALGELTTKQAQADALIADYTKKIADLKKITG